MEIFVKGEGVVWSSCVIISYSQRHVAEMGRKSNEGFRSKCVLLPAMRERMPRRKNNENNNINNNNRRSTTITDRKLR